MSASNSIRVGSQIFEMARAQGELMSRSAAQQIEYWARLGAALEMSGLSVADVTEMLRGSEAVQAEVAAEAEADLWAYKRAQQARDVEAIESGRATNAEMSWFTPAQAKGAKLVDSPY